MNIMNPKLSENFTNVSTHYFDGFYEWNEMKVFYVCFFILITFISPTLLCILIWYENNKLASHYRTVINILLSHVCWISLARSIIARIPYVLMICLGPLPHYACDVIILSGQYLFLCVLYEIMLWQVMKYLHVFYWNSVANLNDEFVAKFLTLVNMLINFLIIVIKYVCGFYYVEVNYHVCTGKHPSSNILSNSYLEKNIDPSKNLLLQLAKLDLHTNYHFYVVLIIMLFTAIRIWIYHKKDCLVNENSQIQENIFPLNNHIVAANKKEKYSHKIKSAVVDSGGSLAAIIVIVLLLIPSFALRRYSSETLESLNYGGGRTLLYISIITLPILVHCALPFVLICSSHKMRTSIVREVKSRLSCTSNDIQIVNY